MRWGWFDHKNSEHAEQWIGFLDQGVRVDGKVETAGTFRINSEMKGTLVSQEMLILGEQAAVEGEIFAKNAILAGRFDGVIRATRKVEIQATGVLTGEIYSPCVSIAPGAVFEGQCHVPTGDGDTAIVIPMRSAGSST